MKTSETIDQISTAMAIAQGEMSPALKTTVNPFFKSRYSSLSQIWEAVKLPLSKNKLTVLQDLVTTERGVSVTTRVCHASGQWVEFGPLDVPSAKRDAQGIGSAASYGRRYALAAALGVTSDEDDDANQACNNKEVQQNVNTKPEPTISPEQCAEILNAIEGNESIKLEVLNTFRQKFGSEKLQDVPLKSFPAIMSWIVGLVAKGGSQ